MQEDATWSGSGARWLLRTSFTSALRLLRQLAVAKWLVLAVAQACPRAAESSSNNTTWCDQLGHPPRAEWRSLYSRSVETCMQAPSWEYCSQHGFTQASSASAVMHQVKSFCGSPDNWAMPRHRNAIFIHSQGLNMNHLTTIFQGCHNR